MNKRDRVVQLAKTDFATAYKMAGSIDDVQRRIQAFGCVARYAPAADIKRVIAAAKKSAVRATDAYAGTMALAWPLRALQETGHGKEISALLKTAVLLSVDVQPAASRVEAVTLLIQAVLPHDLKTAEPAIAKLKAAAGDTHWRVVRGLVHVALMVNAIDRQAATEIANVIPVENKRRSAIRRVSDGETMPVRSFFW